MPSLKQSPIIKFALVISMILVLYFFFSYVTRTASDFGEFEEVKIGVFSLPKKLDVSSFADINVYKILSPIHMSLLTRNYRSDLFSGAAKTWRLSEDKLTYSFTLNTDLKFASSDFSCADVESSFKRAQTQEKPPLGFSLIKSMGCKDAETFEITLKSRSSSFLNTLAHLDTAILPENAERDAETLEGLGPYTFESRTATEVVLVRKNTHPKLNPLSPRRLRFILHKDMEDAFDRFERQEVDLIELEGYVRAPLISNIVTGRHVGRVWFLGFGDKFEPPMEQRRCLFTGMSRSELVAAMAPVSVQFEEAYGVVSPYMYGRSTRPLAPKQNIQKCLTKQVELIAMSTVPDSMVANVKKQLTALGLDVKVSIDEKPAIVGKILSRDYQLVLASFGTDLIPEQTLHYFYSRDSLVPLTKIPDDHVEKELVEINASLSDLERASAVVSFEKARGLEPYIIPLLFQKRAYLLHDCISSDNATTVGVMVYEILRKSRDCAK
jgi:ABC-type oligopeptide transport system substrate-binding subunit